jgi:glyoxylase-like metal-dependent hydrolase (beta-lactamase superfamily II)
MKDSTVTRMLVGGFQLPDSIAPGERVIINSWIVRHPDAIVLVDTGLAEHLPPEDVATMRFTRTPIVEALAAHGLAPGDIDLVINCHLHADHAGGNVQFRGTPILVQPAELEAATADPDYTVPAEVDLADGRWDVREGEHEPLDGIRVIPTPGHSPGHQSVAVETDAGRLLLAGQIFRDASGFARAVTAFRLAQSGFAEPPDFPEWLPGLLDLDPYRVAFGHDHAIWQPDA